MPREPWMRSLFGIKKVVTTQVFHERMAPTAEKAGVSYNAVSRMSRTTTLRGVKLETVLKVMHACGYKLVPRRLSDDEREAGG